MVELNSILLIILIALLTYILFQQKEQVIVKEEPVEVITQTREVPSPLPYWVWYGQPWNTPVYTSPYWFYDVPFYGPITGGDYRRPWGPGGHGSYRPHSGGMGGHTGVAVGGGGGGHGGGGHGGGR